MSRRIKDGYLDFSSVKNYKKWLAYGHMQGIFHGEEKVRIAGKVKKIKHSKRK